MMLKAVNAREFDLVAAWSVDRLGRSLTDLLGILQGLHDKGVDLFLHQQGLDGQWPTDCSTRCPTITQPCCAH
jgi:DNA invertase Pin-like site-specific DNA recombinase